MFKPREREREGEEVLNALALFLSDLVRRERLKDFMGTKEREILTQSLS
jgi:hypothetical protein